MPWRPNRFADRNLNQAIDTIFRVRIMHHERTQNYIQRRIHEGKAHGGKYDERSVATSPEKSTVPSSC